MRLFCLLLSLLPAAAQADCLTAADLDQGIEIVFSNSDRTTIRRISDSLFSYEEVYAAPGYSAWFEGQHAIYTERGFWTVRAGEPDESTNFERIYDIDPSSLPFPDSEGGILSTTFTEATGDLSPENWSSSGLTLAWGPTAPLVLPGCTYEAVGLEFVIDWLDGSGGGSTTWFYVLPSLGIGFVTAAQTRGRPLVAAEPVSITRLGEI